DGGLEPLDRGTGVARFRFDVLFELAPTVEAVLAREHELRVRERDVGLVGQLGTNARSCVGVAVSIGGDELLGQFSLLLQIRARGERSPEWRGHTRASFEGPVSA